MTEQERTDYIRVRYNKLYMLASKHIALRVNKHRVREISKYLDYSVPHYDLILLMKHVQLQPPELKFHYDMSFPKNEDDFRYLSGLEQKQITAMKDLYRKKDDLSMGFSMQFSDGREVRLGNTGDKQTPMRFRDTIWKVQVFSQYSGGKDCFYHNIVFSNSTHDILNQYTLKTNVADSSWGGSQVSIPTNYRLAGVAIFTDKGTEAKWINFIAIPDLAVQKHNLHHWYDTQH